MNVPPACDRTNCFSRAVHVVIDKGSGKILYVCNVHILDVIKPEGTYSIFPAKDYSRRRDEEDASECVIASGDRVPDT